MRDLAEIWTRSVLAPAESAQNLTAITRTPACRILPSIRGDILLTKDRLHCAAAPTVSRTKRRQHRCNSGFLVTRGQAKLVQGKVMLIVQVVDVQDEIAAPVGVPKPSTGAPLGICVVLVKPVSIGEPL